MLDDVEKLKKALEIKKAKLIAKLISEHVNGTLSSEKANGIAGALHLIQELTDKDIVAHETELNKVIETNIKREIKNS